MRRYLVIALFVFLLPASAHAECTMPNGPPAEMGVIVFNKDHKVMQYCNGDVWIGLWGNEGGRSETHWLKNGSNIHYDGYVGIGTNDPQSRLHLAGMLAPLTLQSPEGRASNAVYIRYLSAAGTDTGYVGLGSDGADSLHVWSYVDAVLVGTNTAYPIRFLTNGADKERMRIAADGKVGIGTTNPQSLLHVNGEVRMSSLKGGTTNNFHIDTVTPTGGIYLNYSSTGNVFARGTLLASSDLRLKENIRPINGALQALGSIEGFYFDWKDQERKGTQIGLIAQDVEKVFPEIVTEDQDGFKTISYSALVAPIINAIRELKAENDLLKSRVAMLEDASSAP